ncbi:hypothetical protein SRB5_41140 [Streptomyces sp. RB5]|uniref:Uncharacterized protein n=1 Tax=Streptomyces smaragdinus TaxID=2585196 RepID=A0A7K0CMD7_9ACTN|nr:DUF6412 domain-containing protein [Streptomyces smaragdinus]MQY13954.1 hypothetical protein [Streptomyces smaragdinus]
MRERTGVAVRLLLGALLYLVGVSLHDDVGLTAGVAGAAASAALLLLTAAVTGVIARPLPPGLIRTAIRDRAIRTAFLPQRDPDAAGRSRPRAPGAGLPTAALHHFGG